MFVLACIHKSLAYQVVLPILYHINVNGKPYEDG